MKDFADIISANKNVGHNRSYYPSFGNLEKLDDYLHNFSRMFGNEKMDAMLGSMEGSVRFYGLTPTSMKLEGLDRHQRLIDNYKKLHAARAKAAKL